MIHLIIMTIQVLDKDDIGFVQPWMQKPEPLLRSVVRNVLYPADEEKYGLVKIGWRGPPVNDQRR